jgi:hypothetical protein
MLQRLMWASPWASLQAWTSDNPNWTYETLRPAKFAAASRVCAAGWSLSTGAAWNSKLQLVHYSTASSRIHQLASVASLSTRIPSAYWSQICIMR